jgi:hypothetical protein
MGSITGKSHGRIATPKGLGRIRKLGGKKFECIAQGDKDDLRERGHKLVKSGKYSAYRVTIGTARLNSSWEDELWVR